MKKAAKLIAGEVIGYNGCVVIIAGKAYSVNPPTIRRIAGAAYYLSDADGCETVAQLIDNMKNAGSYAHALSWFVKGDESLADEFAEGTVKELADAMKAVLSLIDAQDFMTLSTSARNVARLAANPRPQATTA